MAGRFLPKTLVASSCASRVRLASTCAVGTTAALAELNATAAACADAATCWACCEVVRSHVRNGATDADIAAADGPCQVSAIDDTAAA